MRIAIHDYAGHPFVFGLSRELARKGHEVRHFFFAGDTGPKGDSQVRIDDPAGFSVSAINMPGDDYDRGNLFARRAADVAYGRLVGEQIAAFAPDVVLSGNTPLEAQASIMRAAGRVNAAFVFWMQDFYSLAIKRLLGSRWLGAGRLIGAWYSRMERRQLSRSDAVVLISEGFHSELKTFALAPSRVYVVPNWGALKELPVRARDNAWAREQGVVDRFVYLYSGTLGLKHDPQMLLDLADACADDPECLVVVASEGAGTRMLREQLAQRPRSNLLARGLQPIEQFPEVLGSADVVLGLLEHDAGGFSVPSKVLSYLCAGRAVLLSAPENNLAAQIVREAGAGVVVRAGDRAAFIAAACDLRRDAIAREEMGRRGRAYAEETFDLPAIADRFSAIFDKAVARRAAV